MLVAATVYMLSGGAGHGGGIWYLLASKPRADEQRRLIVRAAPVILETVSGATRPLDLLSGTDLPRIC